MANESLNRSFHSPGTNGAAEEPQLVAAARAGDKRAFEALAERHAPRLGRVLVRITRNPDAAEDAMQDALVRAWQNISPLPGTLQLLHLADAHRHQRGLPHGARAAGKPTLPLDDAIGERIPSWGAQPEEIFESRGFVAAVDEALGRLPLDYRQAVVLRDVEDLSTREAAEVLGIEEAALKSRLHRGRMALRRELDAFFSGG